VLRITGGKGVDVILDMVAGSYVAREVRCLAEDGRLVIIAVQGGSRRVQCRPGAAPPPDGDRLHAAPAPGPSRRHRQALRAGSGRCWSRPRAPIIHSRFALDAAQAHALMESSQHIGKIVLTW
jgi:NADPH:quinone reductase-like Zn-dependent oxidoreductase